MDASDIFPRSAALDEPAFRLCGTVEGVEFWIRLPQARTVRCVITEAALQDHYGAEFNDPPSWLSTFVRHRADIEGRALTASARRDDVRVVLFNDSEGKLTVSAGRCRS